MLQEIKKKEKVYKRKPANAKRKMYLVTLAGFFSLFFILILSPNFTGKIYQYEEFSLGEYQYLTNNIKIAMVNKEFNPENQTLRIDYSLTSESDSQLLSNIEYTADTKYITQKVDNVETVIYRVSDNYLVVVSTNIPEDFAVTSSTIVPSYISPELQSEPSDLDEIVFKAYVLESDKLINSSLKEESLAVYEQEFIAFSIDNLYVEIEELEKEMAILESANKKLLEKNEKLKGEMEYQTTEEKLQSENDINSNLSTMNNNEKDIGLLQEQIDERHTKIDLLNKKKDSSSNTDE